MIDLLVGLIGAVLGAGAGGYLAWRVARVGARNEARRRTLVEAGRALQDYRVVYAQWYVEYLSPLAQAAKGHYAKPVREQPDPVYLQLQSAVDRGRGALRVTTCLLTAHFPRAVVEPIHEMILKVLRMSGGAPPADCREVDILVESACDLLPDLIRNHCR